MNKDQISGKADQIKGKMKEKVGEAIGSSRLANEGTVDQLKGAAKETWGNVKDAADKTAEHRKHEGEARATQARENIVNTAENVKERVNEKIAEHKERERMHDRKSA